MREKSGNREVEGIARRRSERRGDGGCQGGEKGWGKVEGRDVREEE